MTQYQRGSRGPEVTKIQTRLRELHLYTGPIDGDFGDGTEGAVKAFQQANNLTMDGIVGPNTWDALFRGAKPLASSRRALVRFLREWGDLLSLAGFILLVAVALLRVDCLLTPLVVLVFLFAGFTTLVALSAVSGTEEPSPPAQEGARAVSQDMRWVSPFVFLVLLTYLGLGRMCPQWILSNREVSALVVPLVILFALIAILVIWFVLVFCRKITPGVVAKEDEIIPMVRFCYVFTVAAFALSGAPLLGMLFMNADFYPTMVRSPIGVVKGCVHYPKEADWELACSDTDPYKAQWIVNIGGSGRFANPMPPAPTDIAPAAAVVAARASVGAATPAATPTATSATAPPPTATATATASAAPDATPTMVAVDRSIRFDSVSAPTVVVHGGLAVPWYFIALAIMGAAVSLARKVPEYQKRAISTADSMDGATAREEFEFQILQVMSAPLIAIAAYNLVAPTSISTSAALGFSSGFSSEAILLAIRKLSDSVTGTPTKAPAAKVDDAGLIATITTLLVQDAEFLKTEPQLTAQQVKEMITVENGVVTLTGKLSSDESIKRAVDLTKRVAGVKDVNNKLTKR